MVESLIVKGGMGIVFKEKSKKKMVLQKKGKENGFSEKKMKENTVVK